MENPPTWIVTGGAGFIGSCFVRLCLSRNIARIINLDKLTYAGHLESIPQPPPDRYEFVKGGIEDAELVWEILSQNQPTAVINFAAESHVDRSIDGPSEFVQTNVVGTVNLLEQTLRYFRKLPASMKESFRFLQVSTDEVYGSLGTDGYFVETTPYSPNSPYSASKAASDMFARAYRETYCFPTIITNCSNNYGPYQFPEKLIPLVILNAADGKDIPVYGDGKNVRDWLYVADHCNAILKVLENGRIGETYNVGGDSERTNLEVVHTICDLVDQFLQRAPEDSARHQVTFVTDRPGHDRRYAIDASKIKKELGWKTAYSFEDGLRKTVNWYLSENNWLKSIQGGGFVRHRIGLSN